MIKAAARKANAIAAYQMYVDAKKRAVPNKEKIFQKNSVVFLKFLFPIIACANVKLRVCDYPSDIKAWKQLLKVASDKPKTSWEIKMKKKRSQK